jgi:hypothetical protein
MAREKKKRSYTIERVLSCPPLGVDREVSRLVTRAVFEDLRVLLRSPGRGHLVHMLQDLKKHNVQKDALFIGERQTWAKVFGSKRYKRVIDCVFVADPRRSFTWGSAMYHTLRPGLDLDLLLSLLVQDLGWVPFIAHEDLTVHRATPEEVEEYHRTAAALEAVKRTNNNIIISLPYRLYYLPDTIESRLSLVREMNSKAVSKQPHSGGRTYDVGSLQMCSRLHRAALLHGSNACDWDIKNTAPVLLNWMTDGKFEALQACAHRDELLLYLESLGEGVDPATLKKEIASALNEMGESKMTNDFTRGLAKEQPAIKQMLLERGWITEEESRSRGAIFYAYTRVEAMVIELFEAAAVESDCEVLATIHDGFITLGGNPEETFRRVEERLSKEWGLDLKFIKKYVYN